MFNFFTKKDTEFYDLFLASAKYFNSSAKLINDVMSGNNKAEAKLSDIINIEHEADAVNDKIIDKLHPVSLTLIRRHMGYMAKAFIYEIFCRHRIPIFPGKIVQSLVTHCKIIRAPVCK